MGWDGFRLAYILGKKLRFIYEPVQEFKPPLLVHECLPPRMLQALRAIGRLPASTHRGRCLAYPKPECPPIPGRHHPLNDVQRGI